MNSRVDIVDNKTITKKSSFLKIYLQIAAYTLKRTFLITCVELFNVKALKKLIKCIIFLCKLQIVQDIKKEKKKYKEEL